MSENGEHVSRREVNLIIGKLRWELRAYALLLALLVLFRFQVPQTAADAVGRLF